MNIRDALEELIAAAKHLEDRWEHNLTESASELADTAQRARDALEKYDRTSATFVPRAEPMAMLCLAELLGTIADIDAGDPMPNDRQQALYDQAEAIRERMCGVDFPTLRIDHREGGFSVENVPPGVVVEIRHFPDEVETWNAETGDEPCLPEQEDGETFYRERIVRDADGVIVSDWGRTDLAFVPGVEVTSGERAPTDDEIAPKREVIIEIRGGVGEIVAKPRGVVVRIRDWDNPSEEVTELDEEFDGHDPDWKDAEEET